MALFGHSDRLMVADSIDSNGDLEMEITTFRDEGGETWIDKDSALKLIEHLKNVFEI